MTSEARAQKAWEKRGRKKGNEIDRCKRCGRFRGTHNWLDQLFDRGICKRFEEGE